MILAASSSISVHGIGHTSGLPDFSTSIASLVVQVASSTVVNVLVAQSVISAVSTIVVTLFVIIAELSVLDVLAPSASAEVDVIRTGR